MAASGVPAVTRGTGVPLGGGGGGEGMIAEGGAESLSLQSHRETGARVRYIRAQRDACVECVWLCAVWQCGEALWSMVCVCVEPRQLRRLEYASAKLNRFIAGLWAEARGQHRGSRQG